MAAVDLNREDEVIEVINTDDQMIGNKPTAIERHAVAVAAAPRLVGRFCRDTGGVMAILVALLIPVVVGMMGLTVDVGIWYSEKRALQDAADAAALAGGGELANGSNALTIIAAATADATRNGFDTATDGIVINNPPTSGPNQVDGSVEVIISRQMPLFFTAAFFSLIGATTQQFKATARAVVNTSIVDEFCILGLDPTGAKSVEVTGNGTATLNCGVAVNSDADNALSISGNATLITTSVSTVGNIDLVGGGTLNSESPPERGAVIVDPLKDLVIPTFQGAGDPDPGDNEDIDDGCDKGTYGQGQSGGYTATTDLNASDYGGTMVICGGFTVAAGTTINLGPGI